MADPINPDIKVVQRPDGFIRHLLIDGTDYARAAKRVSVDVIADELPRKEVTITFQTEHFAYRTES